MEEDWEKLEHILEAISNDELVIFAGAGVSMGKPSNLPDFEKLTKKIANGTGDEPTNPLDRFLGKLVDKGVKVHKRAARLLSKNVEPNNLHKDLLRLFPKEKHLRLITTNFDNLFEKAAEERNITLDIYKAPALPLGSDFSGIVHLHGALPNTNDLRYYEKYKNLILTDKDFGRAYLTEGWARRFLVDVFHHFTVLFIGYSYNDIIVSYLTRALPAGRTKNHFILTEDKKNNWDSFGLIPIYFDKTENTDNPYQELYDYIEQLAKLTNRTPQEKDWKK